MALVMKYIDRFHEIFDKNGDPRTRNWPLMSSPFPTLVICLTYVYVVKVLGPKIMENRKPLQLKNVLIFYNLFQVVFSAWLFYECLMGGWLREYSFRCQPVDYSDSPTTIRMVNVCWWYYFSKFTEFMDTIFFVLRKKNEHISTLHVIHHGCMPMSVWFGVKFTPGGHSTFFGLLNTFVHIVMYTYYLLAAFGPSVQKYLWWKKYLTTLQMAQFVAIMVHAFQLLFIDCNYPKAFVWWIGMHAVMFFFLFKEFYKQSYSSIKRKQALSANGKFQENGQASNGSSKSNSSSSFSKQSDYYVTAEVNGLHHRRDVK
ncbi:elongation of very long chain fatty acids protein AAEL008004 isoform X2 [Cimex lectularius]|uniref:Elongation of very long chain fatty acids protein n=1 Tax=Cimex lectularius TaxID=79782 RepID=A0A8I6TKH6_CIMLE|nr:elongation of very long chain fatty acids protein AAEL008004 isoform X2 [Cimex lectularius]XP_024083451.1 elongation of very long chain fatty acids protein AAEL008004 isoform X2 [Cimex lectularius]